MTNSKCASSRGFTGFYAIAIIISCLTIDGALARSTRSTLNATSCDAVKAVFAENTNVSIASLEYGKLRDASGTADSTCGGPCCDRDTEDRLRHQARADFHNLIHHHSRSLQGLLATTAVALRETVTALARQSENKTLTLFEQVYRSMSISIRPSIKALYQAMVDYVSPENTPDTLQQPLTREMLQERFNEFFVRLFPIAYNRAVNPTSENDFTVKFKKCLYETIDEIQPFGDIPKQISRSVGTSLEATRVLVQALTLGRRVLDRTDSVLFYGTSPQQAACYEALLRMTYCPKCAGIGANVRPCGGLCTNVMRGCLTEPASELDLAWSGYVETVERLVVAVDGKTNPLGLNAEKAVKQLDQRISDAIMHAMENGPALDEKVRNVCGHAEPETSPPSANIEDSSASGSYPHQATNQPHKALPTQLHVQLGNFLASVVRSRTFYGTLADAICEEYPDKRCWNGERVGEYTKTVVDSSLTAQRYNPEFTMPGTAAATTTSYGNANTNELIDQLRHINQMVQSQLASAPDNGVLLSDEALDGSGSGSRPIGRKKHNGFYAAGGKHENCPDCEDDDNSREEGRDDDDDDDNGDEEASGSGSGPDTISTSEGTSNEQVPHGAATRNALTPATILVLLWLSVYA